MTKIKGKIPTDVKAEAWIKLNGYDPFINDVFDLDGTLERIALVYGITKEDVAEDLNISDILPVYLECVKFVNSLVFSKLDKIASAGSKKK